MKTLHHVWTMICYSTYFKLKIIFFSGVGVLGIGVVIGISAVIFIVLVGMVALGILFIRNGFRIKGMFQQFGQPSAESVDLKYIPFKKINKNR